MGLQKMIVVVLAFLVAGGVAFADGASRDKVSPQQEMRTLIDLGAGVQKVKSENGVFKSCIVIGQARISKALGAAKGLEVARRNAKLNAEAEFVSWLKTNVSDVRQSGESVEVTLRNDGDGVKETAEAREASARITQATAQGIVRGMQLIAVDQDPKTGLFTSVFAWKPSLAEQAKAVRQSLSADAPATAGEPASPEDEEAKAKAGFGSKTSVASEAAEFL